MDGCENAIRSGRRGHDEECEPPPTDRAAAQSGTERRGRRHRRQRAGIGHLHDAQRLLVHDRLAAATGNGHFAEVSEK